MKNGPYVLILAPHSYPGKKYRGRYAYEHTVLFWKARGFIPKPGFEIHHKNMNHRDNRIRNLQLVTSEEHRKLHGVLLKAKHRITTACGYCSKLLILKGSVFRKRMKQNKFNKVFCTTSCGAKHQFSEVAGRS